MERVVKKWTDSEKALLKELWSKELPVPEIASRFPGRTRGSIIGKANRMGLPQHPDSPSRPTEEDLRLREDCLRLLWNKTSVAMKTLCEDMGLSQKTIRGLARGMGLPARHDCDLYAYTTTALKTAEKLIVSRPVPNPLSTRPEGVSKKDLADDCCAYPLSRRNACGLATENEDEVYCSFHARLEREANLVSL